VTGQRPLLGVVVQRYGAQVTGGSESLARAVAERLAHDYRVRVYTTCAVDYVTWRNALPEGAETLGGVEVRRYPVAGERDLAAFNAFAEPLYARATTGEEELEFLRRQGPESPRLVDAVRAETGERHATLFFTYLYHPTWHGLRAAPERSLLVPTTHDEPPLRFGIYRELFERARALAFLTPKEAELVSSRFAVAGRRSDVTGIGVDLPSSPPDVAGARARHGIEGPYAVYAGRIDAGKGCADMIDFYAAYRQGGGRAALLLLGTLAMELPRVSGLRYLGFLAEAEKQAVMAGASAVVCPSPYESLSIVLLEGFAHGVPALASARSPVLVDHCVRSNGGLFYADGEEFGAALARLVEDAALRSVLGAAGREYVRSRFAWDAVMARWRALVEAAAAS
jgi:glycosyltransferase involved in cell wall biosynthesis